MAIDLSKVQNTEKPVEIARGTEQIPVPEPTPTPRPEATPVPVEVAPALPVVAPTLEVAIPAPEIPVDDLYKKVDGIMSESKDDELKKLYLALPVASQQPVKLNGELTARQITAFLRGPVFPAEQVLELITNWLILLAPNSKDHPWLAQTAKIITDKLQALNEIEHQQ